MTVRQRLLQQLADLTDEDVDALLPIVERLRAKRALASVGETGELPASTTASRRHPERFGPLAGTVRFIGDVESPVESADAWTCDEDNLKS